MAFGGRFCDSFLLTGADNINGAVQLVTVVILFIFVLGITLFTTRWMANYQKGKGYGANIEVIETNRITVNKYIQIVRVGERYLVIGIGKDEITFLTELDRAEIHRPEATGNAVPDFAGILDKLKNLKK